MLRPTRRAATDEVIYLASLAVLAWDATDFMDCLVAAGRRHATVVALDTGRRIPPDASREELAEAQREFLARRRSADAGGGQKVGAAASTKARLEDAARRIALIADEWNRDDVPTPELLLKAGRKPSGRRDVTPMAYQTAAKYLGHRPEAQRKRRIAMAVAEQNRQRKAARDAKK